MVIKPSTVLRNNYPAISALAHKNGEPIYITKNGEGDLVVMSIDAFEKREALVKMREKLLFAEQGRLNGEKSYTVDEAETIINKRYYEKS